MITKSRVNRTEFKIALISSIMCFLGNLLLLESPMSYESRSHLNHDFAMSLFDYQVWKDSWKKIVERLSSNLSVINSSLFQRDSSFALLLIIGCASFLLKPIHQCLISIRNFDIGMIIEKIFGCFGFEKTYKKASFSINNSSKIGEFCICHKHPLFKTLQYTINPIIFTA